MSSAPPQSPKTNVNNPLTRMIYSKKHVGQDSVTKNGLSTREGPVGLSLGEQSSEISLEEVTSNNEDSNDVDSNIQGNMIVPTQDYSSTTTIQSTHLTTISNIINNVYQDR